MGSRFLGLADAPDIAAPRIGSVRICDLEGKRERIWLSWTRRRRDG